MQALEDLKVLHNRQQSLTGRQQNLAGRQQDLADRQQILSDQQQEMATECEVKSKIKEAECTICRAVKSATGHWLFGIDRTHLED